MYCTNCGKETDDKDPICAHCGFDLSDVIAMLEEDDDDDYDLGEAGDTPRTAQEIARRVCVLTAVIACAAGDDAQKNIQWLKDEGLWDDVSPEERELLETGADEQDRINFSWRIEALAVLLWAINKLDDLPPMTEQCDTTPIKLALVWPPDPAAEYIAEATLRGEDEISREYEKVYEAHWAVRDAELNDKEIPDGLDSGVVYERHYGFNWLTGYMGQPWDEVSTDT